MLLQDFYKVEQIDKTGEGKYIVTVFLNNDHAIFKGHFPDNPVTPGVCMMQIIKELTQDIIGRSLQLVSASNVKFMALINPDTNPTLRLELEISGEDEIKVKNTTYFKDTVALKLTNTYKSTE
ncbi:3-hydroxyacyl-ACP dehydratase [Flavobacterium sp. GT3R68]|uniref:ApeI family dehydratase n=1 Tax=Flavobacterium sp. GT3R68 TaxID=2594437 RepID=UPI000F88832F|nr:3-hydroxyacyl-ACP dehydratase [Flavobacterium sp. GT3R68]RTY93937.1 3-hydroxyacyl-ACP dehydratase [Flavobacterium sp. GSN2]TRW93449.1 3-hydroxyacyl-ACP dehydratase [Flavobacterium sp. GT3R68]